MPLYRLTLKTYSGQTFIEGRNTAEVWANDADEAIELVQDASAVHDNNAAWADATVVEVTQPNDYEAWTFNINIDDGTYEAEYVGLEGDTIEDIAAGLAAALVVETLTASSTGADLVIATGGGGDDLGDLAVVITVTAPDTYPATIASADFYTDLVSEGAAEDALSVTLVNGLGGGVTFYKAT